MSILTFENKVIPWLGTVSLVQNEQLAPYRGPNVHLLGSINLHLFYSVIIVYKKYTNKNIHI